MTLVIFNGNTKSTKLIKDKNNKDKIDLIKLNDTNNLDVESSTKLETIENNNKSKISRKFKNIKKKENIEFLDSLKSGSGFKIIPKN